MEKKVAHRWFNGCHGNAPKEETGAMEEIDELFDALEDPRT
jgi:hypothetical protein